jgi:hypothetical protein
MQAPDQEPAPDGATNPGLGRRRFLSVGGGVLAGAGALTLPRPVHGSPDATATTLAAVRRPDRIYPADPRYDTMRMGFNRRWVGSPAYIQLVENARQTVEAVQRAHDRGLRITVRGGGHCYENFSSGNDGGVIIDLSDMQGVYMDRAGRVCVEPGATMWNVYETLFKDYYLTLPGGSCYSVGAGGHIVGGGYGLLSRLRGLVVDYLTGVDVVCVDRHGRARLVRARKGDPVTGRLLWAHTGGGGGNFGIVTAYYFSGLPSPPEQVRVAITTWQWSDLKDLRCPTASPTAASSTIAMSTCRPAGRPSTTRTAIRRCRRSRRAGTRVTCSIMHSPSCPPTTRSGGQRLSLTGRAGCPR